MSLENLHKKCKSTPNCKDPDKMASKLFHHDFSSADAEAAELKGLPFSSIVDLVEKYGPQAIAIVKDIINAWNQKQPAVHEAMAEAPKAKK